MEEFIKAITSIDNEIQKDIIYKLKHKKKLEEYEKLYLIEMSKFLQRHNKKLGVNNGKFSI